MSTLSSTLTPCNEEIAGNSPSLLAGNTWNLAVYSIGLPLIFDPGREFPYNLSRVLSLIKLG